MPSNNRHHTMVITEQNGVITGIMFEKDWFSEQWAGSHEWHVRLERKQGMFHFVGQQTKISLEQANALADAVLKGKISTVDLREMSVTHYARENRKGKGK